MLEKFISFSRRMKELYCTFMQNDFQQTLRIMHRGDFAYLDPPYRLTCGSYNDGKRGFGGWTKAHEDGLFAYIDELNQLGVNFLFSYVQGNDDEQNENLEQWLSERPYHLIQVGAAQGRYGKRKEILVRNYE
jgi:adenine-specific DNA-methyltransferase